MPLVMSCKDGTADVVLANGDRHCEPLRETSPPELSPPIEDGGPLNEEPLEDEENDEDEDEDELRFLQELRERRGMALQVVVEVYTEVHDTT